MRDACPVTCKHPQCVANDDGSDEDGDESSSECVDSTSWYTKVKKSRKGCSWTKGKKGRCKKTDKLGRSGFEACPKQCGMCEA